MDRKVKHLSAVMVYTGVVAAFFITSCHKMPDRKTGLNGYENPEKQQALDRLVSKITSGKGSIREIFPGPSGLTGVIVKADGSPSIVLWVTRDTRAIMAGGLYNASGQNLTDRAYARFGSTFDKIVPVTDPKYVPAALPSGKTATPAIPGQLLPADLSVTNISSVDEGSGKKSVIVFFDPNCIWCHRLWVNLHKGAFPDSVVVKWVPVGFLKPDSRGKAARIMSEGLPALQKDESLFDDKTEEGGIEPLSDDKAFKQVDANLVSLGKIGDVVTPTIVWKAADGIRKFSGFPDDNEWKLIVDSAN